MNDDEIIALARADAQAYVGIWRSHGWDGFPVDTDRALV